MTAALLAAALAALTDDQRAALRRGEAAEVGGRMLTLADFPGGIPDPEPVRTSAPAPELAALQAELDALRTDLDAARGDAKAAGERADRLQAENQKGLEILQQQRDKIGELTRERDQARAEAETLGGGLRASQAEAQSLREGLASASQPRDTAAAVRAAVDRVAPRTRRGLDALTEDALRALAEVRGHDASKLPAKKAELVALLAPEGGE